mmetsp:Transcript_28665/g.68377  ORF Transcript_28665/g.68377 Transcript_28665/m.68377 type:complete len:806 (-) Transcript_28665:90-2507(-)
MANLTVEELLAGLQEAQQAKSAVKLSERNVVELVSRLKELGLVQDLLHTVNGKEFITRERVKAEVANAVQRAGGRISMVDLPPLIGVDLVHCEAAAAVIAEEGTGGALLAQGEIITSDYFDNLALETNEELQEAGAVPLPDLARRTQLSSELLLSNLSSRMGTMLHGRLEGGLLYTQAYVSRVKALLRGALRGFSSPVLVPDLVAKLSKEDPSGAFDLDAKLVTSVVEELLSEGAIQGTLKGGGNNWTPDVYKEAQERSVRSFYEQNGYLDFDHAAKLGLSGPAGRSELSALLPAGMQLSSAIVDPAIVDQLEAAAEEALSSGSWVDLWPLMPSVLPVEDAAALVDRCPSVKGLESGKQPGRVLASTCVASGAFLKSLAERYSVEARAAASEAAAERRKANSAQSRPSAADAPPRKGSKASAPSAAGVAGDPADDEDGDWSIGGKKGKKGGKGGKKGAGKSASAKGGKAPAERAAPAAETDTTRLRAPTASKVSLRLQEWLPELGEPAGDAEVFADVVAAEVLPHAVSEFEAALSAAFTAGAEERRRRCGSLAKLLEASAAHLALFAKGASLITESVGEEDELASAVQRQTVRTAGAESVDLLLRLEELQCEDVDLPEDPQPVLGLTVAERKAIIDLLPKDVADPARAAVESLNGSSISDLKAQLEDAASAAGVRLKPFDKKAEKAAVADFRRKLLEQLAHEADPASALAIAAPLLFAKATGKLVSLPGRAITGVLSIVEGRLPAAVHELVAEFHQGVVAYLKSKSVQPDGTLLSKLEEMLPRLRAFCEEDGFEAAQAEDMNSTG